MEENRQVDPSWSRSDILQTWSKSSLFHVVSWFVLIVAPPVAVSFWKLDISADYVAWYYPLLLLAASLIHEGTKPWIKRNLLWMLTLAASVGVFFGVPQVRYVWYSQTPDSLSDAWLGWWLVFGIFLVFTSLVFSVSVYVVPRRIRPIPPDASWWTRFVLRPVDIAISWPVSARNFLGRRISAIVGMVAVAVSAFAWTLAGPPDAPFIAGIPLSGAICHQACIGTIVLGLWLIAVSVFVPHNPSGREDLAADGEHPFLMTVGRLLGWTFVLYAVDELLWLTAASEAIEIVTLRAYALWGIAAFFMIGVVVAGSLDFLDARIERIPVRLLGLMAFLLFIVLVRPAPNSDVQITQRDAGEGDDYSDLIYDDAYHHLEMRIRQIPRDEPIVFVASSGGGSRAAIFASLVYERLARRALGTGNSPQGMPRTWADNIVLMSSVSGGSLATAHFAKRSCGTSPLVKKLKYTLLDELAHGIQNEIDRLLRQAGKDKNDEDWQRSQDRARRIYEALDQPGSDSEELWIIRNSFTDDMCMNFMAPILRGALSLSMFRGQALGSFWDDALSWRGSSNLEGYTADDSASGPWYSPGRQPVVLFNTCNVSGGSRVAVGFPPLPSDAFDRQAAVYRIPPQGLALGHADYQVSVSLSRAVRFSSNFPWGFYSGVVDLPETGDVPAQQLRLLDGGVTDNTGIDSIFEFITGLEKSDNPHGRRLLRLLKSRTIVLLEIDSGAKPTPTGGLAGFLSVLAEPVQALSNAAYNNAEIARDNYVRGLKTALSDSVALSSAEITDVQDERIPEAAADRFFHITVRCNHFDPRNPDVNEVMTAWALSPQQKASVIARFVLELELLDQKLAAFEMNLDQLRKAQELQELLNPIAPSDRLTDALDAHSDDGERIAELLRPEGKQQDEISRSRLLQLQSQVQQQQLRYAQAQEAIRLIPDGRAEQRREAEQKLSEWKGRIDQNQRKLNAIFDQKGISPDEIRPSRDPETGTPFDPELFLVPEASSQTQADRARIQEQLKQVQQSTTDIRRSLQKLDQKGKEWFDPTQQRRKK